MRRLRLLSTSAFARLVGLSARQVQRHVKHGIIRAVSIGRYCGIPESEVASPLLAEHRKRGRPAKREFT